MKKCLAALTVLALWSIVGVSAQIPAPNEVGVAMGAVHLTVRDLEANKKFFTTLGATAIKIDGEDVMKLPGMFIFLTQGNPSGNNQGTVVNHFGLTVPSVLESAPKWKAAGIKVDEVRNGGEITFIYTPDDQRIEMNPSETPFLATFPLGLKRDSPVAEYHLHFWHREPSVVSEMEAWYTTMLGAARVLPLRAGGVGTLSIPGTLMNFASTPGYGPTPGPPMPIKGHVLDRVGFEVKNLEAFCKKLEGMGVTFDQPYSTSRHKSFASAEFTDRWGTSVQLTEGLNRF